MSSKELDNLLTLLEENKKAFTEEFGAAKTVDEIRAVYKKYTGKGSLLQFLTKSMAGWGKDAEIRG